MNQTSHKILLFFIIPAILVVGMVFVFRDSFIDQQTIPAPSRRDVALQRLYGGAGEFRKSIHVDYNKSLFANAIENAESIEINGPPRGLIVPHHDLAGGMVATAFNSIKQKITTKTIIILGPNHSDISITPVVSAPMDWQTDIGIVKTNVEMLNELKKNGMIEFDETNFVPEYSIKSLIPYVKYYFPEAEVVPLIINSKIVPEDADRLTVQLANYLKDENTLIVSSIDFSHYLSKEKAVEKDEITLAEITQRNLGEIRKLNADYLDSPYSLIVLLKTMGLVDANKMQQLARLNSSDILKGEYGNTTSYFSLLFTK